MWVFSFVLRPFLPSLTCCLPPVTSFAVVLWGSVSVCVLWPTMARVRMDGHLVTPGWWVCCCFVLFPLQWWVRTAGVFFGGELRNSRRLPGMGYVHWFLITSGRWNRGTEGVKRMSVSCQVPSDLQKAVQPALQCHHGGGRQGSTDTPNEDNYFNGKWHELRTGQNARILFYSKNEVWLLVLFHIRRKQKPFHCWKSHTHQVDSTLDYQ